MAEEKLIEDLVNRISQQLPLGKKTDTKTQDELFEQALRIKNEGALKALSPYKLSAIINALIIVFEKLAKQTPSTDEAAVRLARGQIHLLKLMKKCLGAQWHHIKAKVSNLQAVTKEEQIRLRKKEEDILPPPLEEDAVAAGLFRVLVQILSKQHAQLNVELKKQASKVLFQFSACNFDTCIGSISTIFTNPGSEEEILSHLSLIEHLNFNQQRLSLLLDKIGKHSNVFKKGNLHMSLARVLRKAIWNWINNYPMEFHSLCQSNATLEGNPDVLFDTFETWVGNSSNKKIQIWPLLTMLLILCPNIFATIDDTKDASKTKKKFLTETLKKSLKSSKLSDVAAICFVDICKASTFITKKESPFRPIVVKVEADVNDRLFNPQQLVKKGVETTEEEEKLMVDYLVSSFLLNPRKVINELFADCLSPSNPKIFKLVLIQSLLEIAANKSKSASLPWNPSLQDVYPAHAGRIRKLFIEYQREVVIKLEGLDPSATDKKTRQLLDVLKIDKDMLIRIISLYLASPDLALFSVSKTEDENLQDIRALMIGLCSCSAQFAHSTLARTSADALVEFHKSEHIAKWVPENITRGFWEISSSVLISLANILIEQKSLAVQHIQNLVGRLELILRRRNEFLSTSQDIQPDSSSKKLLAESNTKLEIALLIHLCSGKPEIGSKCVVCFGLLCNEVDILGTLDDATTGIAANYSAYKQLATTGVLSTGRQAQQKAMRTTLRQVDRQTPGNSTAWQEVFGRWKKYTELINSDDAANSVASHQSRKARAPSSTGTTKSQNELFQEWTNFLGFLSALCAVVLNTEIVKKVKKPNAKLQDKSVPLIDEFMIELMSLLVCDNVNIRESVKMMLGTALSPAAFSVLFRLLQFEASKLFGDSGQVQISDQSCLFVDQAISVLKLILETDSECELLSDFEDLIMTLLKFVRQLTISVSSLQTKHKLCGLLETTMQKSKSISFRNEYVFRSDLVENIIEWTSEFQSKTKDKELENKQLVKIVKELDLQAMTAISSLLRGLPLQGDDDAAKSASFSKLFSFFTRLLTRCKKEPASVSAHLPEATITALSYLVSANLQHGLEYFVTMGYHEDHETRAAFLHVLGNILNQGAEFDTGDEADKYYKLMELATQEGLSLVLALINSVQITEADKVAMLLVQIFESLDKTEDLIKAAILDEVSKTEAANTLFRQNSMATKLMAAYCKFIGRSYLREVLEDNIKKFSTQKTPLEIDPAKGIPEGQTIEQNQQNLSDLCDKYITDIQTNIPNCPAPFRVICKFLRETVGNKFPGAENTAIAGFMFLRFLCPAIVAPDGYGVLNTNITDKDVRRGLVLITKVLQNLANRVKKPKEPFMECMSSWVENKIPLILQMFNDYCEVPEDAPQPPPLNFSDEQKEQDIGMLHWLLFRNLEKISKALLARSDNEVADSLTAILAQLGQPEEPSITKKPTIVRTTKGQNVHFEAFMKRLSGKNTDVIKDLNIYYQKGKTAKHVPVFYYIARKFAANLDPELVIYYILKTSQQFLTKKWSLVIDLTLFGQEHQIGYPWCSTLAKVMPNAAGENLDAVYLLYPNNWFKKYSKRISKLVSRQTKKIEFVTSISKLLEHIPDAEKALPASTLAIEKNVQATFSPVTKITQYGKKPCILKVGTDMLHICTVKQHPILGQQTTLLDIIHISRIGEIQQNSSDDQDFIISYDWNGQKTIPFKATMATQIVQQLKASKDRYNLSRPQNKLSGSRAFSPSDVPGTLLNMSLLNLTSTNPSLRSAAYNLLCSLCNYCAWRVREDLLEGYELAIPGNSRNFVCRISAQLAISQKDITLEFLLESLHGITKANSLGQHAVLAYIKPWLPNLTAYCHLTNDADSAEKVSKSKEVFNSLIALTIREANDMSPAILNTIWSTIGSLDQIFDLLLSCMVERGVPASSHSALGSKNMTCLEDIIISLASNNNVVLSGKLIASVLNIFKASTDCNIELLSQHETWVKIEVFVRWLMALSFDDAICVEQYLPELFHIIMMTFYCGNAVMKATVHRTLINIAHNMFTTGLCVEDKRSTLRGYLQEFHQLPRRLQFGIGGKNVTPYSKINREEKVDKMPITVVDNVASSMFALLNCCTTSSAIGSTYHARWLSLTIAQAFTPNKALQPRAIVTLGVLCQSSNLVTDNLIRLLLTQLKNSLQCNEVTDISLAIIICLTRMIEQVRARSKFFRRLFWLAMSLVQIHDPRIFLASVGLLEAVLKALEEHGCLSKGLSAYCMASREGNLEPILSKLDQITGISFKQQFSFAVAGHLLKGFKNAQTKTATARVLSTLIDLSKETSGANVLGYLAALLPHKGGEELSLTHIVQNIDTELKPHQLLFHPQMVPDKMNAALLFTFLVTILKSSEFEHEHQFIYQVIQEGVHHVPDAVAVCFGILVPKMSSVILSSRNTTIVDSVLSIIGAIFKYSLDSSNSVAKLSSSYLPTIGFGGLPKSDTFHDTEKSAIIKMTCGVIDGILE